MRAPSPTTERRTPRRGVTLIEMLVTIALLLMMMITIVSVFQAATGSVTESRARALLDQDLRRLDTVLRQDLAGVTCKMTPPNNPNDNRGYFEYAENALSDAQGEDSDDTLRFTAKAPVGRPFTGRVWVPKSVPPDTAPPGYATDPGYNVAPSLPPAAPNGGKAITLEAVPVTSDYAEIIYFQRGDKLYRRVRLILPKHDLQSIGNYPTDPNLQGGSTRSGPSRIGFATNLFEPFSLFLAPPNITLPNGNTVTKTVTISGTSVPFVSWQAINDISARPSDYPANTPPANLTAAGYVPQANTLGDLTDRHKRFASPRFADDFRNNINTATFVPDGLADDVNGDGVPDYYPTMYFNSKAANLLNDNLTAAQRPLTLDATAFPFLYPNAYSGGIQAAVGTIHAPDPNPTLADRTFNHNPVPTGDSLLTPSVGQTWWAFPTWRETAAPTWLDPIKRINDPTTSIFYSETTASAMGETPYQQTKGLSFQSKADGTSYWLPAQPGPFSDGTPTVSAYDLGDAPVFEDDVIATNVRSFNVRAFDPNPRYFNTATNTIVSLLPGYYDLGYISGINPTTGELDENYAKGALLAPTVGATSPLLLDTMGHEGRIPPLVADNRYDAQYPSFSLGDDNAGVVRMRRIWDSWSTTYSNAPALPLDPSTGPLSGFAPVVPSYPAPYPSALRGIEIQIRLTDPDDMRIKTMTIRQDFSEKL